ncbi:branched-chain amino acid aminotransferase [Verruconis gallopava]|uniref:Branched-chain-amino-acid aminotransferase n=1 Tax=Verruconis gallopava TaxID=253628 RepID=A0A0D2AEH3_9PEZI|nr:branched-chain amino acid aminotransferase [Verruconis gallopava]KIW05398.1 branched-chain amino acid aminotransferase [Verruconis gallopava]
MAPTLEATPPRTPLETTTSQLSNNGVAHTLEQTTQSLNAHAKGLPRLAPLDASKLQLTYTTSPRTPPVPGSAEEAAQKTCTDHMITCKWTHTEGWHAPELKPYGPLSLMPTASCLHYATECFEGMKLYRGMDGKLRLFRPDLNVKRMNMSATRIALPGFDPDELLKLVAKLCAVDGAKWLPKETRKGGFLYIRPTMIASDPALGVQKPKEALLYIILCCFPAMDTNTAGMRLLASRDDMVRAWPGGFGFAKVGANYGPTLLCQGEARSRGYDQILWLFGEKHNPLITEAGASNFFVIWRNKETGKREMVTAPLDDKIILDGVTRRSVLELARTRLHDMDVVERKIGIKEVWAAHEDGRLEEAFVCGTAFFVSSVSCINWREQEMNIKVDEKGMGHYAGQIKDWLKGIMYGLESNSWGYIVEEQA